MATIKLTQIPQIPTDVSIKNLCNLCNPWEIIHLQREKSHWFHRSHRWIKQNKICVIRAIREKKLSENKSHRYHRFSQMIHRRESAWSVQSVRNKKLSCEPMSKQTLSYEQSLLREKSRHYLLCYNATCPRKDHCLHWLVGQWASDDTLYATVVNPYRKDVVDGTCADFRSDAKVTMARGLLNFYENLPEGKAKVIRKV